MFFTLAAVQLPELCHTLAVTLALACLVVAASAQTDPGTLTDEAKEWLTGKKLKVKIYSKVR